MCRLPVLGLVALIAAGVLAPALQAQTTGYDTPVYEQRSQPQPPATNTNVPPRGPTDPNKTEAGSLVGDYNVLGTNPDGKQYRGTVKIWLDGNDVRVSWRISNGDTYEGKGRLRGNTLTVNWGARYPVIYKVGADRFLRGTWDNGRAKEDLIPF